VIERALAALATGTRVAGEVAPLLIETDRDLLADLDDVLANDRVPAGDVLGALRNLPPRWKPYHEYTVPKFVAEIGRLDDREPAEVLLALDVRTVGREHLVLLQLHHSGRARRVQAPGEHPGAGRPELCIHGLDVPHDRLQKLGRRRSIRVRLVDAEQVLR
jgi:hypothetical protein